MKRHKRCEPEEADIVLFSREWIWEALKRHPDGLTKDERRKLMELDRVLKANAKLMAKALPELPKIRCCLKPPRSHWWWYLDKLAQQQQATIGEGGRKGAKSERDGKGIFEQRKRR